MNKEKQEVHDFWNSSSCGEELYLNGSEEKDYDYQSSKRYELEGKLIFPFAKFEESKNLRYLKLELGWELIIKNLQKLRLILVG